MTARGFLTAREIALAHFVAPHLALDTNRRPSTSTRKGHIK
jgi:hypothetical protein